jgi:LemA protein
MQPIVVIVIFIILVTIAWFIKTYNRFIKYENRIEEAWSGIDVALKRRYNLIPNLIRAIVLEILAIANQGSFHPPHFF